MARIRKTMESCFGACAELKDGRTWDATPLDPQVLDILLADARERYKADIDRYTQIYTRSGIYLGVLALYVNTLVRFVDKCPSGGPPLLVALLGTGCLVLAVATVLTLCATLAALWGRKMTYTLLPSDWIDYATRAESWYKQAAAQPDVQHGTLEQAVKERMLNRFAEATALNYATYVTRTGYLHWASRFLMVGFLGLLLSAAAYFILIAPSLPAVAHTHPIDSAESRSYRRDMSETKNSTPPAPPEAPPTSAGQSRPTTAPAPLPREPEPRPVRTVNEGEVRTGRILKD